MSLITSVLSILLLLHATSAACPSGWAEFGNYCYWASNTAATYDLARSVCRDYEGDLMAVNSVDERNFVEKIIGHRQHDVWFGLKQDEANTENWVWTDGTQPGPLNETLVKWSCEARPANPCIAGEGVGPCGVYRWHSLMWENHPCDWSKPFVCRRSKDVVDNCDLGADWHQFAGRCYKNMDGKRSWNDARTQCQNVAGQLVMLKNQTYVDAFKRMQSCFDYSVGTWIGLSDVDTEVANTLLWVDMSTYDSTTADWASGQPPADFPQAHKSNCVASYAIDDFKWRINGCGTANRYMCEKSYGVCAEGWHDYGTGFCYQTNTGEHVTWTDAKNICQNRSPSAQLMKVSNAAEQNALNQMLVMFKDAGAGNVRIGVSDQQEDNNYRWADSGSLVYSNWNESLKEQVTDRMDCGNVLTTGNDLGLWGTNYCFDKLPYICRMPIHEAPSFYSEMDDHPELNEDNYVCPSGWQIRSKECYLFMDETFNYPNGKAKCEEHGLESKPVTIKDDGEQSYISNNLRGDSWLGLIKEGENWVWDGTTEQPGFKNWAVNGKGDGTNTCSKLQASPPGQWHHANCESELLNIICKQPAFNNGTQAPTEAPVPTSPIHPECGVGWQYDQMTKNCFALKVGTSVNWEESQRRCVEEMGGNLASITSPQEQTYVNALLATVIGGAVNYWIGLNDRDLEGGWQWSDGYPVPYFNWNSGEPNNHGGDEFCVELSYIYEGRWNDHNCSSLADGYICKKPGMSQITTQAPGVTDPPPATCTEPQAMVSGNMYVQDQHIYARHHQAGREPWKARMKSGSSWEPVDQNAAQYIEVFFPFTRMVTKLEIAGAADRDHFVTKFHALYRTGHGERWNYFRNGSDIIVFTGNALENKNDGVVRDLPEMVYAEGIRIYPQEWNGNISVRFDVHGCKWEQGLCHYWEAVTGETWARDEHMTASGSEVGFEPYNARFREWYNGWETTQPVLDSWLQVQFDTDMKIIEIATLGRMDENRFVSKYKLQVYNRYSPHADKWETYQEPHGEPKTFDGNTNHLEVVSHRLNAEVHATAVRFLPETFTEGIAMKIEINVCPTGCNNIYVVTGPQHSIPDGHLTASTSFDNNHGPNRGRLFTPEENGYSGGWASLGADQDQWIQADIGYKVLVRGITIQGRNNSELQQYVKSFEVLTSEDGQNFRHVTWDGANKTMFHSDWTTESLRTVWFPDPYNAQYVRINPKDWNNQIALRFDIQACPGPYSYEYVGCYGDNVDNRDLPYGFLGSTSGGMTVEMCVYHCYNLGYIFAGTQYGVECHCGNSYGKYGMSTQCNMQCEGNPSQMCGGSRANSIHTTGMSPKSERCADGWLEWGGRCYKFQKKTGEAAYSWNQANYNCQQEGADLVSIRSQAENDFVLSEISQLQESAWIGLHSLANTYHFEWTNYDMVTYTNWRRREPNNVNTEEDCVNMYNDTGTWNDDACSANIYGAYVCEKDKEALPPGTSPPPDPGCGEGWIPYRWKCYHAVTSSETWDDQKKNCEGWGDNSHLARIKDNQEQAFLASHIYGKGGMFYMDLNDKETPGTYKYTDGSSPHYTHWGIGQPGNPVEGTCVAMSTGDGGLWYDIPCGDRHGAICEKDSTTETQPATMPTEPPSGACEPDWIEYGDYCYLAKYENNNFQMTWDDALVWCTGMGANLASFHSQEENDHLWKFYIKDSNSYYWIGLSRANVNDSFKWSDTTEVAFVNWDSNEPNPDESSNCVHMMFESGKWRSSSCTNNKRSWVCKIQRGVAPATPATVVPPTAGPPGSCDPDNDNWKFYNEQCYYFSSDDQADSKRSWYNARTFCQQNNGDLVSIHDAEANNFTMGQVRDVNSWIMWMGLNTLDGTESWSDGTPLDFTHWAVQQPDDQGGTAMCVGYGSNLENYGSWIHDHCSKTFHFICAKNKGAPAPSVPAPTPMPGGCPENYKAYRDKCFLFSEDELTWQQAKDKCYEQNKPYSLASISNLYEQSFLTSQLIDKPHNYWLGLRSTSGMFYWTDNTQIQYTNWSPHEPNGGENEQCGHMFNDVSRAGKWNDAHCEETHRYICMRFKDPALEAPSKPPYCTANEEWADDYIEFDQDCYKVTETTRVWSESEDHCVQDDGTYGHLVSIMNPYEQAFLLSIFLDENSDLINTGSKLWIGLSDYEQEGRFAWTDSRTVTYTNWGGNQPDEPGGGCVVMQLSDGKWIDITCSSSSLNMAICKISDKPKDYTRPPGGSCPGSVRGRDWIEYENDCYMFVDEEVNFGNARQDCQLMGTELVSIHTEAEQKFIYDHIQLPSFTRYWWIGMLRTPSSGFSWTDDSPVEFTYWHEGEPSDNGTVGENCVEMFTYHSGGWNDINCEASNGFVCKTPRSFATQPSTLEPSFPPTDPPLGSSVLTPLPTGGSTTLPGSTQPIPATTTRPTQGVPDIKEPLSPGAVLGIVFGVIALVLLAVVVALVLYRRNQWKKFAAMGGLENPIYQTGDGGNNSANVDYVEDNSTA